MSKDRMWDVLIEVYGVSEETLQVVTCINGYSEETLRDVLYVVAGIRDFEEEDM